MRRPGLSLVELLTALAVTGVTVAGGYASLGALVDHQERVRAASTATARAVAVRAQLAAWLDGAYVTGESGAPPFVATDRRERGRADDELAFLTSAETPLGHGDVVVRLFVERDARTPERGLVAEFTDRWGRRAQRLELDSSVVALDVRCLTDQRVRRTWLGSWMSADVLPLGVELRFEALTPGRLTPLLRVPVTVSLAGGR